MLQSQRMEVVAVKAGLVKLPGGQKIRHLCHGAQVAAAVRVTAGGEVPVKRPERAVIRLVAVANNREILVEQGHLPVDVEAVKRKESQPT